MGLIPELFGRPLYHGGKMADTVLRRPERAANDVQPTVYGTVPDDLEAMIDADPLNWQNHGILSDWHRDQGNLDEADFRGAMRDWLRVRSEMNPPYPPYKGKEWAYPWQVQYPHPNQEQILPEGVTANGEGPWNPDNLPTRASGGQAWGEYRQMEAAMRRSFMSARAQLPTQASRYERRNAPPGGVTHNDKVYRSGQFIPGTVMFQHTPKRAPERWRPEAPADVQPTEYGDVEDLEAAVHASPADSTRHLVMADALDDRHAQAGDPNDALAAEFRRAMGAWLQDKGEYWAHRIAEAPWSVRRGDYPAGVKHHHLPGWENEFTGYVNNVRTPDHHPVHSATFDSMYWPNYRSMETAFWEAFGKGRGVVAPDDVQPTTPEPTGYGDVPPVAQVDDPTVLTHRRREGAERMRRLTDKRAAAPVEENAARIVRALQTHGPLRRSHLLSKTKIYGGAFPAALAHLGDRLTVERRGAHPNGGGPPTEVWALRPEEPAQDDMGVQPTEYAGFTTPADLEAMIHENPYDWGSRLTLSDLHRDAGNDEEADFQQSMADWVRGHHEAGTVRELQGPDNEPGWRVGGQLGYPAGIGNLNSPLRDFDLPVTPNDRIGRPTAPHHPTGNWNGMWLNKIYPYQLSWDDYPSMEQALRIAFGNARRANQARTQQNQAAEPPTPYAGPWDLDPPDDVQPADFDIWGESPQLPPVPPPAAPDPMPGNSPQAPVVMEHLGILQGGAHDSAFPQLAKAYLGAIPPAERDAVFRAVGIDPLGADPVADLASLVGGPRHHRAQANVPTDPPDAPTDVQPAERGWGDWTPTTPAQHALHHTPVVREEPVGVRSANATNKLTFADGTQGVFKPWGGERGLRDGIDMGTYWRREVAASDVAELLGFGDLVPPTAFRRHDGQEGSVQRFVPDALPAHYVTEQARFDGQTDAGRAAVFDYLTANTDRHTGNWLMTPEGKLVLIDNGLAFPHTIDHTDFVDQEFLANAAVNNLPVPDLTHLRDRWPAVEAALERAGLEHTAIAYTKWRFDQLTSGNYWTVGQLPAYWNGSMEPVRDHL